jgi:23S rRNA (guanosine2251-2'-O)-methyltransferase
MEILYGRNAVYEALRAGRRRCSKVLVAEGTREGGTTARILALAEERGVEIERVARQQLGQLGEVNHQGVAAQTSTYPYAELDDMLNLAQQRGELPFLLLLDCLQDPQNLGTLLRTAEAVAVHGVVIPHRRAAQVTPAVSNASAGAVEHLLIAQITNLVRTMARLKNQGLWSVGLEHTPEAQDYREADLNMPLALVVGSEGEGLRRLVRERCDLLIKLPMRGNIGSLNASVAGSIALYEAWHRRGRPYPQRD